MSDPVRVAVANLVDEGDAAALEKCYHKACLIYAEISCKDQNESDDHNEHMRNVCDAVIVVYLRERLEGGDVSVSMKDINEVYIGMLRGKGAEIKSDSLNKKHLKHLIKDHVPGVDFIAPVNPNNSHLVTLKKNHIQCSRLCK